MQIDRRKFTELALGAFGIGVSSLIPAVVAQQNSLTEKLIEVEQRLGARLGFAAIDEETGRSWSYQADQLFPMCSTFKLIAAAAFLSRVDSALDSLERRVIIDRDELVSYSPLTETRVGEPGLTMAEICVAALTLSDNTAGNKILESIGGPSGLTEFARSLGDEVTRLDRWETELNQALIGDPRDTTSPHAIVQTLRKLLFGDALSPASQLQLRDWMVANETGDAKLRAGFPSSWLVGDKTGGGDNGSMADVAAIWRGSSAPMIVAVYMSETTASFDERNAGIADIARALSLEV